MKLAISVLIPLCVLTLAAVLFLRGHSGAQVPTIVGAPAGNIGLRRETSAALEKIVVESFGEENLTWDRVVPRLNELLEQSGASPGKRFAMGPYVKSLSYLFMSADEFAVEESQKRMGYLRGSGGAEAARPGPNFAHCSLKSILDELAYGIGATFLERDDAIWIVPRESLAGEMTQLEFPIYVPEIAGQIRNHPGGIAAILAGAGLSMYPGSGAAMLPSGRGLIVRDTPAVLAVAKELAQPTCWKSDYDPTLVEWCEDSMYYFPQNLRSWKNHLSGTP